MAGCNRKHLYLVSNAPKFTELTEVFYINKIGVTSDGLPNLFESHYKGVVRIPWSNIHKTCGNMPDICQVLRKC